MSDVQFRRDVYVYNESTGLVITSAKQGERWGERLDDVKAARKGVKSGAFIALELYQDDPLLVRVVVGGEITPEEQNSWVDRFAARLNVSDGRLALCGGIEFLTGDANEDDDFVQIVEIPAGGYCADVFTLIPGVNGYYGNTDSSLLVSYWQRTRPGEDPPEWVTDSVTDESPRYVDFLVHLTSVTDDIPEPVFQEDEYWFPIALNRRTPERCPVGIQAVGPIQGDETAS